MREEIIKMAREAGFIVGEPWREMLIERFFHMAQAHALSNIDPSSFMSYQEGYAAGQAAEREACAKVCDDISAKYKWPDDTAEKVASQWCADRIRARGQA